MVGPRRLPPLLGSHRRRSSVILLRPSLTQSMSNTGLHSAPSTPREVGELRPMETISPTQLKPGQEGCGRGVVTFSNHLPELEELTEMLLQKGYMDGPDVFCKNPFLSSKDTNRIRTACLDFARDRFDLFKYLTKNDINVIVGCGCPSLDRKVVNSGKRLRAYLGIQEANVYVKLVCGKCNSRGNCERAYMEACEVEGGRTVDVMRILLTYGLDMINGSVDSSFRVNSNIRESSRKLLKDMLAHSANEAKSDCPRVEPRNVSSTLQQSIGKEMPKSHSNSTREGDWICPKCDFLNFKKNIRCLRCDEISQEKLNKLQEERKHLPLKRGDWICKTCSFLNFAKNTKCLQCNGKPIQRHLGPGEWECPSCYFVNFRRNTVCLRCDWKRPKALVAKTASADFQLDANKQSTVPYKNNQNYSLQPDNPMRGKDKAFWSSDDDDGDPKNFMKFEDFPIAGGKKGISQDALGNHEWNDDRKSSDRSKADKEKISSASVNFCHSTLCETSDDDDDREISGWFRPRFNKNNG